MRFPALLLCAVAAWGQEWTPAQVGQAMAPMDFVLLLDRGGAPQQWALNLQATDAFQPCSTFKLPHALIALDTGVISRRQNRRRCVPQECHANHGGLELAGAIQASCLSYFRQLARAICPARMVAGLKKIGYPVTGPLEPLDGFWLTGDLRVTADQQLQWIRRFCTEPLPVEAGQLAAVRAATLRASSPRYTLHGKTGSSREGFGWFTGQITRQGRPAWVVVLLKGKGASGLEAERRLRLLLDGLV